MAKYINADCKLCRREGAKLFLKGEKCTSKKCPLEVRATAPGQHGTIRKKASEYNVHLREKQKAKRAYGLLEKQFHAYYVKASAMKGIAGENMLRLIEMRLDNVAYRMGIGASRAQSRQIVNHGLLTVNGHIVDIPSYQVKVGDIIAVKESKKDNAFFKELKGAKIIMPKWVEFDTENFTGKVLAKPEREDIDLTINEQLIIEHYSK